MDGCMAKQLYSRGVGQGISKKPHSWGKPHTGRRRRRACCERAVGLRKDRQDGKGQWFVCKIWRARFAKLSILIINALAVALIHLFSLWPVRAN